jgi:hypothetical protein
MQASNPPAKKWWNQVWPLILLLQRLQEVCLHCSLNGDGDSLLAGTRRAKVNALENPG